MKLALSPLILGAVASANIIFRHVPLVCEKFSEMIYHGCLRGQICKDDNTCTTLADEDNSRYLRIKPSHHRREDVYSATSVPGETKANMPFGSKIRAFTDTRCTKDGCCGYADCNCVTGSRSRCITPRAAGMCGVQHGGATCDSEGPYGRCCSQYGYCGSTDGHCLTSKGCQSGCNDVSKPLASQEPVIVRTTSAAPPNSTAPVTSDGKCGASKGGTVCGDWPYGNCCSMYGFCGNTSAHCGAGCQSGNCLSAAVAPASGPRPAPAAPQQGSFAIIGQSGVPAMHAALLPNGRVVFLDKLENYTQVRLPGGHYAMSAEYNPADNTVVPLAYKTNAFCCGGCFLADGSVVSLGGNAPLAWLDPTIGDGFDAVRYLHRSSTDPSLNGRNWTEPGNKLASNRWYASAQTMSNGSIFVASGSLNGLDPTVLTNNNPTYEILNASAVSQGVNFVLDILKKNQPYYMYPFLHLLPDDSLFIFVSKSSEQYSVASQRTIKTFPELSGDYRTYPNTGSSVLLPLSSSKDWRPEIIICGGGAYQDITSPTDPSCGRIQPFSDTPEWEMDAMPEGRGMVEGTLLPDGTIIWLNGGNRGAQGFGLMADPTQTALLYEPGRSLGQRFSTLASSDIPRLYHSVALLLLDGTLMVAGSNPVQMPVLTPDAQNPYATEFRVERYTPPYLEGANSTRRPKDIVLSCKTLIPKATFTAVFSVPAGAVAPSVVLYQGGFVTHSLHMGHRMVVCDTAGWVAGNIKQNLIVTMPPNSSIVPPGPYVVYVLADGIPGIGQFVRIGII